MSGAYNDGGLLHIFQQHVRVGTFAIELKLGLDARLNLVAPETQGRLILSDGERILVVNSAGQVTDGLGHPLYGGGAGRLAQRRAAGRGRHR